MRLDLSNGLPEAVLEKIRRHSAGSEDLESRAIRCHYCGHTTIYVFTNSRGHVKAKCKKCGSEAIYNVLLRRSGAVVFRLARG
jgi:ribosomal protein S27E